MNKEGFTHLVINGCSFAFGESVNYKDRWYTKLASELNLVPVVLAAPGGGNDRIFRTTTEYALEKNYLPRYVFNPLFILCFTQSERREEFDNTYKAPAAVGMPDPEDYENSTLFSQAIFDASTTLDGLVFNMFRKHLHWLGTISVLESMNYSYLTTDYFPEYHQEVKSQFNSKYPELVNRLYADPYKLTDFEEVTRDFESLPCGHDSAEAQAYLSEFVLDEYYKIFSQ